MRDRRRAARAAAFGWGCGDRRSRLGPARPRARRRRGAGRRGGAGSPPPSRSPASRSSSCPSPDPRASSASRGSRAPSSSRSTCRAAWRRRTSRRPAWRRRRPPRSRSSSGRRPRSGSGSSCSATPASRPRSRRTSGPPVVAAIQRLGPERGTSLARGILASLTAIDARGRSAGGRLLHEPLARADAGADAGPAPAPTSRPSSSCSPTARTPRSLIRREAAQAARDRGIRIDTVGIGTAAGTTIEVEGFAIHTEPRRGASCRPSPRATDGTYYPATDQDDLTRIYDDVGSKLVVRTEPFELTPLFAAAGFALLRRRRPGVAALVRTHAMTMSTGAP